MFLGKGPARRDGQLRRLRWLLLRFPERNVPLGDGLHSQGGLIYGPYSGTRNLFLTGNP